MKTQSRRIVFTTLGTILVVSGIVLLFVGPTFVEYLTDKMFDFKPNSTIYKSWELNPVPIPLDIYIFNWTNPHEIRDRSTKPKFEELGPYRFTQKIHKEDVQWNRNDTVTYKQRTIYTFDGNYTKRSLSDNITTVNAIATMSAYKSRFWSYAVRKALSLALRSISADVNITKTAGELLFDGYKDPLLSMANNFPFLAEPGMPMLDKFGWFRIKNDTLYIDGVMNMGISKDNFGELKNWNYKTHTDFYKGECGKVQGSSGQFYKRPITRESAKLFSPDICTYIQLDFEEEVYVKNILGHKYVFGESALDNGTKIKENSCYCTGECIPSGMKNITNCRFGTPSFISLPSFYKADPYYLNSVDGIKPQKELHDSYIIFEPNTGLPLVVNLALQGNVLVQPIDNIGIFEKVPKIFFPVMWFKQSFTIPDDMASNLNIFLKLSSIINILGSILIFVGFLIIIYYLYRIFNIGANDRLKQQLKVETVPLNSIKK